MSAIMNNGFLGLVCLHVEMPPPRHARLALRPHCSLHPHLSRDTPLSRYTHFFRHTNSPSFPFQCSRCRTIERSIHLSCSGGMCRCSCTCLSSLRRSATLLPSACCRNRKQAFGLAIRGSGVGYAVIVLHTAAADGQTKSLLSIPAACR